MPSKAGLHLEYKWVILGLGWFIYFCCGLSWFSISPMLTSIMIELHITHTEAGLLLAAIPTMYVATAILGGLFADRVGVWKAMGIATVILGIFGLLRSVSINFITLIILTSITGVGCAMVSPAIPKLAAMWFPPEKVGTANGILSIGFSFGMALSLAIVNSVVIPLTGNWRGAFLLFGIISLIAATLWWILAKKQPASSLHILVQRVSMREAFSKVIRSRDVWLLTLIGNCFFGVSIGFTQWLPHILELRGITEIMAGYLASLGTWFGLFVMVIVPMISDHLGLRKPFIIVEALLAGFAIYAVGALNILGTPLWILSAMSGIMYGILPIMFVIPMGLKEVGPRYTGAASGMIHSIGHIGSFVTPFLVGYLADVTGSFAPGMIIIALLQEAIIIFALPLKETGQKRRRSLQA